jgi:NAD(P)-dependent dehydrogenase (short-subunit alcohol dehydrogenase family)
MENLSGKTILITGSTDGIGKQTACKLAQMGATVILHGRDEERARSTAEELRRSLPAAVFEYAAADFSSLQEVRALAEDIRRRFPRLDVLINNAGVYMKDRVLTKDGYETTFGVNYLAHFLLTNLLLDLLKKSTPSRIIHISSIAHTNGRLDLENLQGEKRFDPYGAYALSKLALILMSKELSERLKGTNVTSNALHPGVINTKLLRAGFNIHGADVQGGAEISVFLASSPKIARTTGKYFIKYKETFPSSIAENAYLRSKLWKESERLTGLSA